MSIKIMTEVWESAPVSGGTLLVLLALADSADEKLRSCFPGIENLAHKARLSERQVKRAIGELVGLGMIDVKRNASPFKTNLYTVNTIQSWPRSDILSPANGGVEVTFDASRCDTHVTSDVTPMSPKPSVTSEEPLDLFGSVEPHRDACVKVGKVEPASSKQKADEKFDRFWAAYPKKIGKPHARKNFAKAIAAGADPEAIIAAAVLYADTEAVKRGFVKHPQGWLTDERWNDPDLKPKSTFRPLKSEPWNEVVR